ncbi:MAG: InlB B-repeat-containing protein, partial [Clostridia bacterium]|nr:InlB B-repeat-containing protein [Clostridia bacterium]
MKRQRVLLIIVLALICSFCAAFAFGCSDKVTYYTVTFMDGQTQIGETVKVQKGRKIEEYPVAVGTNPDDVFDGWYKDEGLNKVWNHDIERVTKDTTLWAGFIRVSAIPNNVAMADVAFSNTLTWLQRGVTTESAFKVELAGTDIVSGGKEEFDFESFKGHDDILTVKWTPAQKPTGGVYSAMITGGEAESITVDGLMFKGAGTSENPYLVTTSNDFDAVNTQNVEQGSYYKLAQSVTVRASAAAVADKTFDGVFNGNG